MKKILLSLLCLFAVVATKAESLTLVMSDQVGDQTIGQIIVSADGYTDNGLTITTAKNTSSTAPAYNANGKDLRVYAKGSITIVSDVPMTEVVFNISTQGKKRLAPITASTGQIAAQSADDETVTWTGEATELTLTVGDKAEYGSEGVSKAGQLCFTSIDFTMAAVAGPTVSRVTFSPQAGEVMPGTEVKLACATEGAAIHYTLDASVPTAESTLYTAPIVITDDVVIKAIAVTDNASSEVAEAIYTVVPTYNNLSQIVALPKNSKFVCGLDLVVFEVFGANVFVYDPAKEEFALIYKYDLGLNKGDIIVAGWDGTIGTFGALNQLVPTAATLPISEYQGSAPWTPEVDAYSFEYVFTEYNVRHPYILKSVTMTAFSGKNATGKIGSTEFAVYNQFNLDFSDVQEGGLYDIYGVVSSYNGNMQFNPITFTAPSFALVSNPKDFAEVDEIATLLINGVLDEVKLPVAINENCTDVPTFMTRTGSLDDINVAAEIVEVDGINTLKLTCDPVIKDYGVYTLNIPAGYLVVDDKGVNEESWITLIIAEPIEPVTLTVDPEAGKYDKLSTITINAPGIEDATAALDDVNITITSDNGEVVYSITAFELNNNSFDYVNWQFLGFELKPEITAEGTYTLDIPADFFEFSNMARSLPLQVVYIVDPSLSSIITIVNPGDGETYYDLRGVRVDKPTAGSTYIRIANGKATKVVVK